MVQLFIELYKYIYLSGAATDVTEHIGWINIFLSRSTCLFVCILQYETFWFLHWNFITFWFVACWILFSTFEGVGGDGWDAAAAPPVAAAAADVVPGVAPAVAPTGWD